MKQDTTKFNQTRHTKHVHLSLKSSSKFTIKNLAFLMCKLLNFYRVLWVRDVDEKLETVTHSR